MSHYDEKYVQQLQDTLTKCADKLEAALAEISQLQAERDRLGSMLAIAYSGVGLYTDDGELQDGSKHPTIDFKRDSVEEIQRKIEERGRKALEPQ